MANSLTMPTDICVTPSSLCRPFSKSLPKAHHDSPDGPDLQWNASNPLPVPLSGLHHRATSGMLGAGRSDPTVDANQVSYESNSKYISQVPLLSASSHTVFL